MNKCHENEHWSKRPKQISPVTIQSSITYYTVLHTKQWHYGNRQMSWKWALIKQTQTNITNNDSVRLKHNIVLHTEHWCYGNEQTAWKWALIKQTQTNITSSHSVRLKHNIVLLMTTCTQQMQPLMCRDWVVGTETVKQQQYIKTCKSVPPSHAKLQLECTQLQGTVQSCRISGMHRHNHTYSSESKLS